MDIYIYRVVVICQVACLDSFGAFSLYAGESVYMYSGVFEKVDDIGRWM